MDYLSLRDLTCVHSWVRLTEYPLTQREFTDLTLGGLNGCFNYAVRPVWPTGEEGNVERILDVNLTHDPESGTTHCDEDLKTFDIASEDKVEVPTTPNEKDRINDCERGSGLPDGPDAPQLVDLNNDEFQERNNGRLDPVEGLYAFIDWLPNQESDLAGYYVEMAGSVRSLDTCDPRPDRMVGDALRCPHLALGCSRLRLRLFSGRAGLRSVSCNRGGQ